MGNVPKLRFSEFSTKWDNKHLGKYGELVRGLTYSPDDIREEGLLVLRSSNIKNNEFTLKIDNVYVDMQIKKEYLTQKNDILICVRNGSKRLIGKSAIINNSLEYATHGAFMSVFRGKYNKFIYHWMQTPIYYKQVHKNLGATINSINGSDLKKFKTYFPKDEEQEKIASFLSAVDKKIEKLEEQIALEEKYKKAMMQKLFSQEIRFKADDGSDFPDWEEKKYNEIYSFYSTNSLSRDKLNYEKGNVKNIHYGDIHTKFKTIFDIENENVPFVNLELDISKIKEESYCLLGDLIIADASEDYKDIGKTIELINLNNEKLIAGLHTFLARPNKYDMALGFAGYLLQSWKIRKQVMTISQGTKVLSLSTSRLGNIKLDIPSKQEQQKIANFLSSLDKKIEATKKQKQKAQEFKKGLLQQMFV